MTSFAEVTRKVHLINDLILSDMICGNDDPTEEKLQYTKHMLATKYWFVRISYANKKRFVLALIKDVRSIWTLSLLLKSIWNCRPKDAVMSACESIVWSSYDQVPMDHDRTALPLLTLAEVMMSDRKWFKTLEPERQALVLSELLTVAGGPIIWEVLKRAQQIYEQHVETQLEDLQECIIVHEPPPPKKSASVETTPQKKEQSARHKNSPDNDVTKQINIPTSGQAQKELETNLALWATTVKSIKDSMKLEELEMTYKNGTAKKIWKVSRPRLEAVETVDFIQLLPSTVSKRILMYLPNAQLGDYARVNKYWAYLIDEFRAELLARQKIDVELEKMRENMIKHDRSLDLSKSGVDTVTTFNTIPVGTAKTKERISFLTSNKSCALSLYTIMNKQAKKPRIRPKPIRNINDLNDRLEKRGAADENIWKWCRNMLKISEKYGFRQTQVVKGGILSMGTETFPGPVATKSVNIPLDYPLVCDPTHKHCPANPQAIITCLDDASRCKQKEHKRYTLWSKDLSRLYPVCKISSHMSPF